MLTAPTRKHQVSERRALIFRVVNGLSLAFANRSAQSAYIRIVTSGNHQLNDYVAQYSATGAVINPKPATRSKSAVAMLCSDALDLPNCDIELQFLNDTGSRYPSVPSFNYLFAVPSFDHLALL